MTKSRMSVVERAAFRTIFSWRFHEARALSCLVAMRTLLIWASTTLTSLRGGSLAELCVSVLWHVCVCMFKIPEVKVRLKKGRAVRERERERGSLVLNVGSLKRFRWKCFKYHNVPLLVISALLSGKPTPVCGAVEGAVRGSALSASWMALTGFCSKSTASLCYSYYLFIRS